MTSSRAGRHGEAGGERSPTFAAAIRYVEHHGFSVIPLKPGSKVPALESWKEYQDRKPTLDELERWFAGANNNVGIVTGKVSGIVVVDVDGHEGEESIRALRIPRTPTSKTPHGRHFFLRHPGPRVPNRAHVAPGVDIRADGGFVVGPPSRGSAGTYSFLPSLGLDDVTPGPVTSLPKAWLNGGGTVIRPRLPEQIHDGQERWRHLLSLAGTLRNRGLNEAELVEQLTVFNRNRCRPPKPEADVRRIVRWVVEHDSTAGLVETSDPADPRSLEEVVQAYRQWLYVPDPAAIYYPLGVYVAHRRPGDPVWGFVVAAPSAGKTEGLTALSGRPDVYRLSSLTKATFASGAKPEKGQRNPSLLMRLREDGKDFLLLKDFGTVLSMHRDDRQGVLSQLRELYDGQFTRDLGNARTVEWEGRLGFLAGCVPAIDAHHSVISTLGERFTYLRLPGEDREKRMEASLRRRGREKDMRAEIRDAVDGYLGSVNFAREVLISGDTERRLVALADFVTRARSPVTRSSDHDRTIEELPEPEFPMRFGLQLAYLLEAFLAMGFEEEDAWKLVRRVGLDSLPPRRLRILRALRAMGEGSAKTIAVETGVPTVTARRTLEDLLVLGMVARESGLEDDKRSDGWRLLEDAERRWETFE